MCPCLCLPAHIRASRRQVKTVGNAAASTLKSWVKGAAMGSMQTHGHRGHLDTLATSWAHAGHSPPQCHTWGRASRLPHQVPHRVYRAMLTFPTLRAPIEGQAKHLPLCK